MKTICVLLLALLMTFDLGIASEVNDPSPVSNETVVDEVKKDPQALSGKWKIHKLSLSSVADRFSETLDQNFVGHTEISYDHGNLEMKSYKTDNTKFIESRAGFNGQKFVVKVNGREQVFDVVAYKRQTYIALQPSSKSLMQRQNILGFIWVYEDKTLEKSKVVELKFELEDYYIDTLKQERSLN